MAKKKILPKNHTSGKVRTLEGKSEIFFPVAETAIVEPIVVPEVFVEIKTEEENPHDGSIAVQVTVEDITPVAPQCTCIGYEGQAYFCTLHTSKVECPRCHCVDTEQEIADPTPSVIHYKCKICGIFYLRQLETGEYQE